MANGVFSLLMYVLSKIFWAVAQPGSIILVLLSIGVLLLWIKRDGAKRWGRRLLTLVAVPMLALAILPLEQLYLQPLEQRFQRPAVMPERVDGIIALGGALSVYRSWLEQYPEMNESGDRIAALMSLAQRYPEAKVVFSGGSPFPGFPEARESLYAKKLMEDMGMPPGRVIPETQSRNTYENALFSKELVQPQPDETWILITSGIHMPRAVGVFRAVGWQVIPYPVDLYDWRREWLDLTFNPLYGLDTLQLSLKEWVGLVYYDWNGWTSELFPGP